MCKNFDIFDVLMYCIIGTIGGLFLFLIFVATPMQYRAERVCADNGYLLSSFYMDGAVYCEKKNEFGAIDIVKVK